MGRTEKVFVEEVTFEWSFEEWMRFMDERSVVPGRGKSRSKGRSLLRQ